MIRTKFTTTLIDRVIREMKDEAKFLGVNVNDIIEVMWETRNHFTLSENIFTEMGNIRDKERNN